MKNVIAFAILASSFSAMADVEFYQRVENEECIIAKNTITKKMTFANKQMGFTITKGFSGFGFEEMAKKAAALSSGRTSSIIVESYVKIDGVKSTLSFEDSKEAAYLLGFISNACK